MSAFANAVPGHKTVKEVVLVPEVEKALITWVKNTSPEIRGVLVGGIAYSFYAQPRQTSDIDLVYLHLDADMQIPGFKKVRHHSYRDSDTHVEVEVLTPGHLKLSSGLITKIIHTAIDKQGLKVASAEGLVAMKLHTIRSKDETDVIEILKNFPDLSLDGWPVAKPEKDKLEVCRQRAAQEKQHELK